MENRFQGKVKWLLAAPAVLWLAGCEGATDVERAIEEILAADRAFSALSVAEGTHAAFDQYMAEDATIYRDKAHPFTGRAAILALFAQGGETVLSWEPTFATAAESADLGYSLGLYVYTYADSMGEQQQSRGYYITIWQRQSDRSWKYVFDSGVRAPPRYGPS